MLYTIQNGAWVWIKKECEWLLILCKKTVLRGMIHCYFEKTIISPDPLTLLFCRLRDRVTVKTGPRHTVRETDNGTFQMIIKSAARSDAGIYTCKIINEYGTKQCEGKLQVQGMLCFFKVFVCSLSHYFCSVTLAVVCDWYCLLPNFQTPSSCTQHHQLSLDWR